MIVAFKQLYKSQYNHIMRARVRSYMYTVNISVHAARYITAEHALLKSLEAFMLPIQ